MPRAGLDTEAVVIAAARLADAEGLAALSLARLAAELDIRPPSLYAHVDGLDDLRRRLGNRGACELAARLQAAAAGLTRSQALGAVAAEYRGYARAHPGLYAAMQRPAEQSNGAQDAAPAELVELILAVLRGYDLEGPDAIHAARIVRSALHGFVALEGEAGFRIPLDLDETYSRLVFLLDAGLSGASRS
jgi:AcrR family transcriptional regulator